MEIGGPDRKCFLYRMTSLDFLRKALLPASRGIEIGPWRNPIAPKRGGFQTLVIDIFGAEELRQKARRMEIPEARVAAIEEVDIVGDASCLFELVRAKGLHEQFEWIVSSHNFEHLPDPIRFLQGCESLLKSGGFVGMIIPDKRNCFDRFRSTTNVADLVRAHHDGASGTAAAFAMFAQQALKTTLVLPNGTERHSWPASLNHAGHLRTQDIRAKYATLKESLALNSLPDFVGHRWQFCPAAFELAILDLRALGLTNFHLEEIAPAEDGQNFAVRLRLAPAEEVGSEDYVTRRSGLCRRIEDETAAVAGHCLRLENDLAAARAELAEIKALLVRQNGSPMVCESPDPEHTKREPDPNHTRLRTPGLA